MLTSVDLKMNAKTMFSQISKHKLRSARSNGLTNFDFVRIFIRYMYSCIKENNINSINIILGVNDQRRIINVESAGH